MSAIRPQYHLRQTADGIDAFDTRRLIELSKELPVKMIDPSSLAELDLDHWYFHTKSGPTPRSLLEHMRLVLAADTTHPIILDQRGRVMDGMHRVVKALLDGANEVPAVQFIEDPTPDYLGCDPDKLPYD